VRIWNYAKECPLHVLEGHSGPVEAITIYQSLTPLIISGGRDATVRVWDMFSGDLYQTLESDAASLNAIAVSNCCDLPYPFSNQHQSSRNQKPVIISCESESTIRVWDFDRVIRDMKWRRRKPWAFIVARYKQISNKTSQPSTLHYFINGFLRGISSTKSEPSRKIMSVVLNEELQQYIAAFL
jgi:WD40 repeat protein